MRIPNLVTGVTARRDCEVAAPIRSEHVARIRRAVGVLLGAAAGRDYDVSFF